MTYKCECCKHSEEFETPKAAFEAGWDTPPYFHYVGCPYCPGAMIVMGKTEDHQAAHEHWAANGRPKSE